MSSKQTNSQLLAIERKHRRASWFRVAIAMWTTAIAMFGVVVFLLIGRAPPS